MSWLLKVLPYLLAVAVCAAWSGLIWHLAGKSSGNAVRLEWQAERTANARAAVDAFTRTLSAQWQMTENLAARDAAHAKEIQRVQGEKALLEHKLRTGGVRVSVPPASPPVLQAGLQVPPLPASLHKREPNLTQRLRQLWQESPATETRPSSTSTPASTVTTKSASESTP